MRDRDAAREAASQAAENETIEEIAGLRLSQPRKGYRFGIDPVLLAAFVQPRRRERVLDLGAGCGIIALLLAHRWPTLRLWGIELQAELARLAEQNVRRNSLDDRCTIFHGDAREFQSLFKERHFQRIVSNPPFRAPRAGRIALQPGRALARQELALTLDDLASAAAFFLGHGGILDFIHLPERLPEIFQVLSRKGLEPKRLRLVHSFPDSAPEMALISARRGGRRGLKVLPPLVIFRSPGSYTAEVAGMLRGGQG
jgi:tRNA1Val (adenine37-N6)-methyltransferase